MNLKERVYKIILNSWRKGITLDDICLHTGLSIDIIKKEIGYLESEGKIFLFVWRGPKIPKQLYLVRGLKPSKASYGPKSFSNYRLKQRRPAVGVFLRRLIFDRDNSMCQRCGLTNKSSLIKFGRRLEIDHIQGQINGLEANQPDNLQLLCRDCNIKKGTYNL